MRADHLTTTWSREVMALIKILFQKMGLFFFMFVFSIQLTVNNVQYKFRRWLDSNRGPLVSEATALPTESQLLPKNTNYLIEWALSPSAHQSPTLNHNSLAAIQYKLETSHYHKLRLSDALIEAEKVMLIAFIKSSLYSSISLRSNRAKHFRLSDCCQSRVSNL